MGPIVQGFVEPGKPPVRRQPRAESRAGPERQAKVTFVDSPALTFADAGDRPRLLDGPPRRRRRRSPPGPRIRAPLAIARPCRHSEEPRSESGDEESARRRPGAPDSEVARYTAAAFGTLVHALLALPEFPEGDALARRPRPSRAGSSLDEHDAAEAADLAQRVRALPALAAIGAADVVYRELPFVYRAGGQVLDGRIDLAYRVGGSWTVIDFKTARLAQRRRGPRPLRRTAPPLPDGPRSPDRRARLGLPLPRPHGRAGGRR